MLTDKIVIVTGAGSGIGRATSLILAKAGARVVAADLLEDAAVDTADMITKSGGDAHPFQVDVANEDSVRAMVAFTKEKYGRLDGAFNNAGIMNQGRLPDALDASDWKAVLDVNLSGVFYCLKHEIAMMRETGGGAIVNNSSVCGQVGMQFGVEYVASKHGVLGITRGAACDAKATGVRVNAVLPGYIQTPMTAAAERDNPALAEMYTAIIAGHPIGRMGQPEDVGYAVKWLLSDESGFVNGASIAVDGGFTIQ